MKNKALYDYISTFVPITTNDWNLLKDNLVINEYNKKDNILGIGQICKGIYFIEKGTVRIFEITKDGKEASVFFGLENTFITNYSSLLSQKESQQGFQAIENTKIVLLPYLAILKGYDMSKNWERFGRLMAEHVFINEITRRIDLQKLSHKERYHYLLSNYPEWLMKIPLNYLASYIGMTKESLSRIRKKKAE